MISRDYISLACARGPGILSRASSAREPSSRFDDRLETDVTAERWTRLDRCLPAKREAAEGVIDLRADRDGARDPLRDIRIGRMRTLERMGLAEPVGQRAGCWSPMQSSDCESSANAAILSSGCTRPSQRMDAAARHRPGRSRANAMATQLSAVSWPAGSTMIWGARPLPSLTGSMGACTT